MSVHYPAPHSYWEEHVIERWITLEEALRTHYPFQAIVSPDGSWHITFPDLPGCMTDADDWDEIVPSMREVLELWLTSEAERGHPIPAPTIGEPGGYEPWRGNLTLSPEELAAVKEMPTFSTQEAAAELGVSPRRVQELARSRRVGRRIGRALVFSCADVERMKERIPGRPPHRLVRAE